MQSGYVDVNGLHMYYERHGQGGVPLVLLHGGASAIGTSFGEILPGLAEGRQVFAFEFQAHGHTADIDRAMTMSALAEDIAAGLGVLGVSQADVLGYSIGAGVALELAVRRPELVRKLVLISLAIDNAGLQPGQVEGMDSLQPEMMVGSPFYDEYMRLAPRPEDFPRLVERLKEISRSNPGWPAEAVRNLQAPALLIAGDADIVQAEHVVAMFRLLGGGGMGMMEGPSKSQLAIIPGATHITVAHKADVLLAIIPPFLDASLSGGHSE